MSLSDRDDIRIEHDLLGDCAVPRTALHGAHTQRALSNVALSGRPLHPEIIRAFGAVKRACARTNMNLGHLSREVAEALIMACDELEDGELCRHIVVDALQGGAGTSANMNVNEVLANRAEEILGGTRGQYQLVAPLAHVNLHQSTNDVFPTAVRIAALRLLARLEPAIAALQAAFQTHEASFAQVVRLGRTQLQDAVPMTFGAACGAWAEALSRDRWRVFKCSERLRVVNLGGTAIGTGIAAPRSYILSVVDRLREDTGLPLARAENLMDATQNVDAFVEVSGILKSHASNLLKISSDLRLLASGPGGGIGEVVLPPVQAGSSIMPGKVNPVVCETVAQAAMQATANDLAITLSAQHGQLELNAFMPLIADALLHGIELLTNACDLFRTRCVEGLHPDTETCARHVSTSTATLTALVPEIGYTAASEMARHMREHGTDVFGAAKATGLIDEDRLAGLLSPERLTALGYKG